MKKLILTILLCSGCYTTKLEFSGAGAGDVQIERELQHTFFWGLVSPGHVDPDQECKGGRSKPSNRRSPALDCSRTG